MFFSHSGVGPSQKPIIERNAIKIGGIMDFKRLCLFWGYNRGVLWKSKKVMSLSYLGKKLVLGKSVRWRARGARPALTFV